MIIKFENFNIDSFEQNGDFFVRASVVCDILGFAHHISAVRNHCITKGVLRKHTPTSGGMQEIIYINEANLYSLIFNKPPVRKKDTAEIIQTKQRAERFKWYIFEEVLPMIRKTGSFSINHDINELISFTERGTQIQKSKEINALQFALGGVEAVKEYNRQNCKAVTGMETRQIKSLGEKLGLKSKQRNSTKEVLRNVPELKSKACTMTLNDTIVAKNPKIKLEKLQELDKNADKVFQELLNLGINPAELNK